MNPQENCSQEYWKEKKVLITGGTSGLGRALATRLNELGAQVSVVARHAPQKDPLPPGIGFIEADVSDIRSVHRIHAQALSQLGAIDVLLNNASTLGPTPLRPLLDTDCEDLSQVLETNLVGPFRLTKLVLPEMLLAESGVVVNVSSDAAVSAYPEWGAYSASKAALDHLTRVWQAELEETGVRFLALDPGDMDTPLHLAAIPDADRSRLHRPEDSAARILELIAREEPGPVRRGIR